MFDDDFKPEVFQELALVAVADLGRNIPSHDIEPLIQRAYSMGDHKWTKEKLLTAIHELEHIFRQALKSNLSSDEFSQLLRRDKRLSEENTTFLTALWREKKESLQLCVKPVTVGKLLDVKWKVGFSVSSDVCHKVSSPYVVLKFQTCQPGGVNTTRCVEMTIAQFQAFHNQLKDAALALSTV
ncbi:COMM domain-containing protein 6-like [Limulus polyphemus]|uniref:COMM domain-containing protein 6 n=1 Tax=Limulus polyphemus TaxID=6850 RepID=A0ABM1BV24_LIMPO|nr:COMM domain-containing protein 6-like [Limulus polyphemus]